MLLTFPIRSLKTQTNYTIYRQMQCIRGDTEQLYQPHLQLIVTQQRVAICSQCIEICDQTCSIYQNKCSSICILQVRAFTSMISLKEKMLLICVRETAQGVYSNCTIWYYIELIKELLRNASWALFHCTITLTAASLTARRSQKCQVCSNSKVQTSQVDQYILVVTNF